jgi:hypothetical protein
VTLRRQVIACARQCGLVSLVALTCGSFVFGSELRSATEADGPIAYFAFDGDALDSIHAKLEGRLGAVATYGKGLAGKAYSLRASAASSMIEFMDDSLGCQQGQSFSVKFWLRTTAAEDARMLVLSNKLFQDNSLASQQQAGWAFLVSHGTWSWNMGSGKRRLCYERDNGSHMPINDGRWHQLAMTYDSTNSVVHLYCDGQNKAIYNVHDSKGFDFSTDQPIVVGMAHGALPTESAILPAIRNGATTIQELVDAFHRLGAGELTSEEFVHMIVDPKQLYERKLVAQREEAGAQAEELLPSAEAPDFTPIKRLESQLMGNPYTIHQALTFMEAAPLLKLYSLVDGHVVIDEAAAMAFSAREQLHPSDFDIDELGFWDRALSVDEVRLSYEEHFQAQALATFGRQSNITVGVWNIFHGGLHFTVDDHGWDSRRAIAQIIEREGLDVVLLQETYSAGDFIAAELGWYFATTVDWDYLNQGANISVLSRYPIVELRVPPTASFMNVAARIRVSETQDLWAMSNWYGMDSFPDVAEFHAKRFAACDTTPVLFGGDFNAIPESDGGKSLAASVLLGQGFTDAYRSMYPSPSEQPGHTHRSGRRIDQLYYKGAGLQNTSTRVLADWPTEFPSDHYLIRATFELPASE